jgi:hypothetical protein
MQQCWLLASGCFWRLKAPLEQVTALRSRGPPHSRTSPRHACDDSVKERPIPSAGRRRWDAVLQGESDLAQLREIHPALLSIGVLNGQVCEQATDYFAKSKSPSGKKMEPQGRELHRFTGRSERKSTRESIVNLASNGDGFAIGVSLCYRPSLHAKPGRNEFLRAGV